ncbi:MAG: aminotransferase class I/II-fold pyridoxal phosphate-dependent enzyme [Acidobacteria bacterium]|nr:aminotransferase class I/II-fold pyridoxal phosphate-dependent enzyme [Acidobacteriota bacterium]
MPSRFDAPYMAWAKSRPAARYDLGVSNILSCSLDDLPGAREALDFTGRNDNGYPPLLEAIASRYGVTADRVTTATGASGANFLVCAALLQAGDEVLVERPGYDPLLGAPRMLGAVPVRFDRVFERQYALDADRVRQAMTPRTKLIVLTTPHNPTSALTDSGTLEEIGRLAESAGALVMVDEVYLDAAVENANGGRTRVAATRGDVFISTSSLTKSYGLSSLRCGWIIASAAVTAKLRRAHDVVDGTGSIVTERLSVVAFNHLDALVRRARALLDTNGALVRAFLRTRPELEWVDPGGGPVVFPRLCTVDDTSRFAERLLDERDTAIVPGRFFQAPSHFRLGFSGATEPLRGGLAALGDALDARAW